MDPAAIAAARLVILSLYCRVRLLIFSLFSFLMDKRKLKDKSPPFHGEIGEEAQTDAGRIQLIYSISSSSLPPSFISLHSSSSPFLYFSYLVF